jgi:hypothetical protein
MRISVVVLSVAFTCTLFGCGAQDSQVTPEQAKARKAEDDVRATHMNQYDDQLKQQGSEKGVTGG